MGILISSGGKKADMSVPVANGSGNKTINQLLGNRNDDHDVRTIFSNTNDVWEGFHHAQKVYPTLADAVTVTSDAAAWTLGNFAEVIPANAIIADFHIHHIAIVEPSANGEYELVLYNGAAEIGRVSFTRTDKKDDIEGLVFIADHCEANSQIRAKLAFGGGGGTKTAKVKVWYHPH